MAQTIGLLLSTTPIALAESLGNGGIVALKEGEYERTT